jgi:hypothetical protein
MTITKKNGNFLADKVDAATLADAKAWQESNEKIMFAVEYFEVFSVDQIADFWIGELEDRFEEILAKA